LRGGFPPAADSSGPTRAKYGWQKFLANLEQVLARIDFEVCRHHQEPGAADGVEWRRHLRVNAMANKTSIKSTKVAKKAAAKRVAAKAAKPRKNGTEVAVPQGREAGPPRRRQPSDREGRR
jgi:hypothetical protein